MITLEVTGVCSTTNLEMVKSLGADMVIDYTQEDFTKNSQTYDIIFDTVGKRSFSHCKGSLTQKGVYLDAAGLATILPMLWTSMFSNKKAILAATYLRPASKLIPDLVLLKELIEDGKVKSVIDRCYPLDQTAKAYSYVAAGHKSGNVVISVISERANGLNAINSVRETQWEKTA